MRLNDAVLGVILLLFAAAVIVHAQTSFPGLPGQDYGPAFFPTVIGSGLALCGIIFVIQGVARLREVPLVRLGSWASSSRHVANLLVVLGALLFYILLSDILGFFITSTVLLTGLLVQFRNRFLPSLGLAVAATFVVHFFFYKMLLVPLPWGFLEPFAW